MSVVPKEADAGADDGPAVDGQLTDVLEAWQYSEGGHTRGKLVLVVDEDVASQSGL